MPWAAIAAAGVFLVALASRFGNLLSAMSWNSDAAFFPLLAEALPAPRPGEWISLGNTPHYISLAFLVATKWLPGHTAVWDVAPLLLSFCVAALLGAGVARVAGRWAALITVSLCLAPSHPVLMTVIPHAFRTWTWFADAVLALLLVSVILRPGASSGFRAAAASILGGLDLASDPLFLASGLAPFVAAALLHRLRRGGEGARRALVVAAAVAAGSILVAVGVTVAMRGFGFVATYDAGRPAVEGGQLWRNAYLLGVGVLALGNGLVPDPADIGVRSIAMAVCAVLTTVAAGVTMASAARVLRQPLVSVPGGAPRQGPGAEPPGGGLSGAGDGPAVWTLYWALSCLFVAGAFLATPFGAADPEGSSRYLPPIYYGLAAVVPVWAAGSGLRRTLVGGGVALACLTAIWGQGDVLRPASDPSLGALLRSPVMRDVVRIDRLRLPMREAHGPILDYLVEQGVSRGYAGYWDSHGFSWHSRHAAVAYPVVACRAPASDVLCPLNIASASVWYQPVEGPSFLLVGPPGVLAVGPPSEVFGPPSGVRSFGSYTVYVFDYDIASRFLPAPPPYGA